MVTLVQFKAEFSSLSCLCGFAIACDQDLDLHEIIVETQRQGMTFDQLLTMPEQDEWIYSDGKSTTCVAFVLELYKEAGILGPLANSIQVTEFTVSAMIIMAK